MTKTALLKSISATLKRLGYGRGWAYQVRLWADWDTYDDWDDRDHPSGAINPDLEAWSYMRGDVAPGMVVEVWCARSIDVSRDRLGWYEHETLYLNPDPDHPGCVVAL